MPAGTLYGRHSYELSLYPTKQGKGEVKPLSANGIVAPKLSLSESWRLIMQFLTLLLHRDKSSG